MKAFPGQPTFDQDANRTIWQEGMDLRDYFAGLALQGMNANPELLETVTKAPWWDSKRETWFSKMADNAYMQADALIKARDKHGNQ